MSAQPVTSRNRRRGHLFATLTAGLLLLAACGGSTPYGSSGGSSSRTATPPAAGGASLVKVAKTDLGSVLETADGRVVYLLTSDTSDSTTCSGSCLQVWPPVTVSGTPQASGVGAAIGSFSRPDGSKQLTVAGHPAYTYAGDQSPGQTSGEGITSFGGTWWALSPTGTAVMGHSSGAGSPAPGGTGSSSAGVRGY